MVGPGRRGKMLKLVTKSSHGSKASASFNASKQATLENLASGSSEFLTPNASPTESPIDKLPEGQPRSSESGVNGHGNEEQENRAEMDVNQDQDMSNDLHLDGHETGPHTPGESTITRRGSTRNIGLNKKRNAQQKLKIEVEQDVGRVVGDDSQYFITESGCVVRKVARHNVTKWAKLEDKHRNDLYKSAMAGFEVDGLPYTKLAIFKQLNTQYRTRRYKLHLWYLKFNSKEEAKNHVPEKVRLEDWTWLCEYFSSEAFKTVSERNKKNRQHQDTPTTVGTKSLARVVHEKKRKEGVELSEIDLYRLSRYSRKKGCMVNDKAKNIVDKMDELKTTTSMTPKEICMQEIGHVPGQTRGRVTSKSHAAIFEQFRAENDKNLKRAEHAEQQVTAMAVEIKLLKEQQQENNQLYRELLERLNALGK